MKHIFIDESGDLGKSSKNIVISAIIVDDQTKLERPLIKANRYYKKQLKKTNEIKGFNTPHYIIKNILKKLNKIDYEIHTVILNKENKYKINYNYNNNLLYNIIASKLAEIILINEKTQIVIDRSKSNDKEIELSNEMFENNLNNPKDYPITINHLSSVHTKGLQIADLIAWSFFQKIEHENDEFVNILKNKNIKEIFKD